MTKLTNDFILGAALQYKQLGAEIEKLEATRKDLRDTIVGEMDRRGAKAIEHDGYKVLAIQSTQRDYDVGQAKQLLTRPRYAAITKTVVDRAALEAEIEAGRIKQDLADTFTITTPRGAKYPRLIVPKA